MDHNARIRRIVIDICQAGNYLDANDFDPAIENISDTIESLKHLIEMIEHG